MKGIVLAGGTGSRLKPLTISVSKQLLPVFNKPMIFYPIDTLLRLGVREILLISTSKDLPSYRNLLGDGSQFGVSMFYDVQDFPSGVAEGLIIGEDFVGSDSVALILGDNVFHGIDKYGFGGGASVFAYRVSNPSDYGVVNIKDGVVKSIEEKPIVPKSNLALTGLYLFDNRACQLAKSVKPSQRGELEIVDVLKQYKEELLVTILDKHVAWLDTGSFESLHNASNYVQTIEARTGIQIGNLADTARELGLI